MGGLLMLAAGFFPVSIIGELVSLGTLLAFANVCVGVLFSRVKKPDLERPFKTPFVFFTAPAGAIAALLMMLGLPKETWVRLLVWMAIGLVIYLAYGRRRTR